MNNLDEQLTKDTNKYKSLFKTLAKEGRLNDRMPNDGKKHDESSEYADLIRYEKSLEEEGSLSFMN